MRYNEIIKRLKSLSNPKDREGMARFGINPKYALGVRIPVLRQIAKVVEKNHDLAKQLWDSRIHEARILASMVEEFEKVTEKQMDAWIQGFNSWDLCDQCCMNLFDRLPFAYEKAIKLAKQKEEFVKRAGFVLMACLAAHDKKADDRKFIKFFSSIKEASRDERNFVKKAVNWALRQIGKRSLILNKKAISTAKEIQKMGTKVAKWIASDAINELTSTAVKERLKRKSR